MSEIPRGILMMALAGRWRRQRICIAIHQRLHRIYHARRVCCMTAGCLLRQWSILCIDAIAQSLANWFLDEFSELWCFHLVLVRLERSQNISKLPKRHSKISNNWVKHFWIANRALLATRGDFHRTTTLWSVDDGKETNMKMTVAHFGHSSSDTNSNDFFSTPITMTMNEKQKTFDQR
jgi:hypothetical protein